MGVKARAEEGATAGEEGEEPHRLAEVYPPNSMAAPPRNSAVWGRQEGSDSITATTN